MSGLRTFAHLRESCLNLNFQLKLPPGMLSKVLIDGGIYLSDELGALFASNLVKVGGKPVRGDETVQPGSRISVSGTEIEILGGCGGNRLQARVLTSKEHVETPVRVHCGLHKCLTEYTKRIYRNSCGHFLSGNGSFRHFFHRDDAFYAHGHQHRICSVSGRVLDFSRYRDIRAVRLVRDPRDLVVSSYFYHKRGAEHWCFYPDPTDTDWWMVNGKVPQGLSPGESLKDFLDRSSIEAGIEAEVEFRQFHFQSMMDWPEDERVLVIRYEDFLGREAATMRKVFRFLGFNLQEQWLGGHFAKKYSAARVSAENRHIRDPSTAQWKQYFSQEMNRRFCARWGDLLERYGYDA